MSLTSPWCRPRGTTSQLDGPDGWPAEVLKDYALYGLIVEGGPAGTVFVRITGPKATVQAQQEQIETFAPQRKGD